MSDTPTFKETITARRDYLIRRVAALKGKAGVEVLRGKLQEATLILRQIEMMEAQHG